MSRKEKLIQRIKSLSKDFTFQELEALFSHFGFQITNKGKTSGSGVKFYHIEKRMQYMAHKPHSGSIIKEKALKDVVTYFIANNLINY
ncbi:type II toxin-antitoxin system HicA family toxin [Capnocytophaga sp. ARDL2]|uniref:type II toxin-antitoxin system HicA family toxin n=1 Tax=Capnocytophaga sp. ARDL2 TaxID=3238809 RepID=UPI003558DA50